MEPSLSFGSILYMMQPAWLNVKYDCDFTDTKASSGICLLIKIKLVGRRQKWWTKWGVLSRLSISWCFCYSCSCFCCLILILVPMVTSVVCACACGCDWVSGCYVYLFSCNIVVAFGMMPLAVLQWFWKAFFSHSASPPPFFAFLKSPFQTVIKLCLVWMRMG